VVYEAATQTLILTPRRRLDIHRRFRLTVNGSTPTGVVDLNGNLLDGDANGQPGGDYTAILRGFGPDEPRRPFRVLIRDQLHGRPLASMQSTSRSLHSKAHLFDRSDANRRMSHAPLHNLSTHHVSRGIDAFRPLLTRRIL